VLQPSRRAVAVLGVIGAIALLQGFLATRRDLDDHARFTSAVYMSAARNYVRYGFLREAGVPLKSGGSYELAREARYLNWPVREFLELGAWFQAFGVSVPVARARTVVWTLVGLAALAWGVWGIPRSGLRGAQANPALLPGRGSCSPWCGRWSLAPVAFVLPAGEATEELGRALGRRFPSTRVGSALISDLRGGMTRKSEVAARPIAIIEASPFRP